MEELISRIMTNVGIDEDTARNAVGIILSFLYNEGDREKVVALIEKIPGAETLVKSSEPDSSASLGGLGGLGGLMGGGAMAVLGELQGIGLGMGQVQSVTKEVVDFARKTAGDEVIDDIVGSIPGLSQFL